MTCDVQGSSLLLQEWSISNNFNTYTRVQVITIYICNKHYNKVKCWDISFIYSSLFFIYSLILYRTILQVHYIRFCYLLSLHTLVSKFFAYIQVVIWSVLMGNVHVG